MHCSLLPAPLLAGAKDMCTWAACFGLGAVVGLFCINPDAGVHCRIWGDSCSKLRGMLCAATAPARHVNPEPIWATYAGCHCAFLPLPNLLSSSSLLSSARRLWHVGGRGAAAGGPLGPQLCTGRLPAVAAAQVRAVESAALARSAIVALAAACGSSEELAATVTVAALLADLQPAF